MKKQHSKTVVAGEKLRQPAYIVKPRKPATNAYCIIVVYDINGDLFLTEYGETGNFDAFSTYIHTASPHIVITDNSVQFLCKMHQRWSFDKNWFARVTPNTRDIFSPAAQRHGSRMFNKTWSVSYFEWRNKNCGRNNTERRRQHFILDIITFRDYPLKSHAPLDLIQFGKELRKFCINKQVNIKPTQGGISIQLLRDKLFYPNPRRKVPRDTNDKVRKHLPGCYYEKRVEPNREFTVLKIDQEKAHHYHAEQTPLPDANSLLAYGRFHSDNLGDVSTPWRVRQDRVDSFLRGFHGLIYGRLEYKPKPFRYPWTPPYLNNTNKPVFWYTNERRLLDSLGAKPVDIIAAWGSKEEDEGLSKYARWAQSLTDLPDWFKPLLLATYGALAQVPRQFSVGYTQSNGGEWVNISAGKFGSFPVRMHTSRTISEPNTNNVLHRGLIEAATRTESMIYANYLQSKGWSVLGIYVDCLFVLDKGTSPPLMLPPWRLKGTRHHFRYGDNNTWYWSDEEDKTPGMSGSSAKRYRPKMKHSKSHIFWNRDPGRRDHGARIVHPPQTARHIRKLLVSPHRNPPRNARRAPGEAVP